jgi:tetratricopeptide (TPR) repeat protein
MTHYDDEILNAYLLDASLVDDAAVIEAHLEVCGRCRDEVDVLRAFGETMREPAAWDEVDALRTSPERLTQALALSASIEKEDRAAAWMLARYLRSPLLFRNAGIAAQARFRSAGAVRVLCTAAYKLHEQRPRFSYDVAMEAWKIATQLPEDHPLRRVCLGLALREQATALRYLGRFAEALEALDKAETLARGTPSADVFDLALVWTIRATVYLESERPADALPLAQAAARVFRDYGDEYRECAAAIFEASSHLLMGAPDRAARAFERVIVSAEKRHDNVVLASAMNNAAVAYADLGQLDRAAGYYAKAIALYDELQRPTEAARARWALASLLVASGDLLGGIAALAAAREELASLSLMNDAALATLEWAEARLAADMPAGVAEACRSVMVTFGSEGMERSARVALAYLHERSPEARPLRRSCGTFANICAIYPRHRNATSRLCPNAAPPRYLSDKESSCEPFNGTWQRCRSWR